MFQQIFSSAILTFSFSILIFSSPLSYRYTKIDEPFGFYFSRTQNNMAFLTSKTIPTSLLEYSNFLSNNIINDGQVRCCIYWFHRIFFKNWIVDVSSTNWKTIFLSATVCDHGSYLSWAIENKWFALTKINHVFSSINHRFFATSSVPQGWILAPLLINYLPTLSEWIGLLFADDLKILQKFP